MADGTLPVEKFKVYLVQDYLFLVSEAFRTYLYPALRNHLDTILTSTRVGRLQSKIARGY
jgi:thiaminase